MRKNFSETSRKVVWQWTSISKRSLLSVLMRSSLKSPREPKHNSNVPLVRVIGAQEWILVLPANLTKLNFVKRIGNFLWSILPKKMRITFPFLSHRLLQSPLKINWRRQVLSARLRLFHKLTSPRILPIPHLQWMRKRVKKWNLPKWAN